MWAPPVTATGPAWRQWVTSAVRAAFLPPEGASIDITGHLNRHPGSDSEPRVEAGVEGGVEVDSRPAARSWAPDNATGVSTGQVQPFWASLITHAPVPGTALPGCAVTAPHEHRPAGARFDLVLADIDADVLGPDHDTDPATEHTGNTTEGPSDRPTGSASGSASGRGVGGVVVDARLGILAAQLLRRGGILAVLTRCHTAPHTGPHTPDPGEARQLIDPTGLVVASAQNADLLYLQHVVIPTAPLTRHLTPPTDQTGSDRRSGRTEIQQPQHDNPISRWRRFAVEHVDLLVFRCSNGPEPEPDGPDRDSTMPAPASLAEHEGGVTR